MALINLSPVVLMIFAAGWLGGKVGRRETISLLLGFSGMLICIRPEFSYLSLLALAPLLDAVSVAFGSTLIRKYPEEPTLNWIFYQEMIGFLAGLLLWMVLDHELPDGGELKAISLFVLIDIAAMTMNYHAFRHTKASLLAPWFYILIPAAAFFGFLIFSEIPHWTTFAGAGLIDIGGIWNSWFPNGRFSG